MMLRPGRIVLCCLLAAFTPAVLAQELPRKQFEVRVEETGTRLGRTAMRSSLPLNRRYAELDDAEKAQLRANYEGMPAADEPPFPAQGLLPIFNALHEGMDKLGAVGEITLVADVDTEGKVRHVDAFGSINPDFARFASRVLTATPFKPGVCASKPCNMQYVLRMAFSRI
ncbi:MAG: hypothetical protein ACT6S0_01410 [Roseateles sp.]|uniref:hypothetical protein n=1 Tax=Roseateles sp. TaxID=1971397 RepID=UPI004035DC81